MSLAMSGGSGLFQLKSVANIFDMRVEIYPFCDGYRDTTRKSYAFDKKRAVE